MKLCGAAFVLCFLVAGTAFGREGGGDGRQHLKRANELAAAGRCAAAIREYTAAYEKLHDPMLLFNRAECYRRIGENAKAAEGYRAFLAGSPAAPNRAELEARIAALERPAPPAAPALGAVEGPMLVLPPGPTGVSERESQGEGAGQGLVAAPGSEAADDTTGVEGHRPRWWLWTTLAVVAVGCGVAGYVLLRPKEQPLPPTTLGNYPF